MVTWESLEAQLKRVNFNINGWGRTEAKELVNILHDHEEIFELVNGYYDGGFALLVATNLRLILVDKKPLNYLTVEDVRFDMINEIDYNHRLIGAHVNVATGTNKTLRFTSLNQARLRKTIGHVQHSIAIAKKNESEHAADQKGHLAQINSQLQEYLLAQHQQHQSLKAQLEEVKGGQKAPEEVKLEPVKPSHELSDYLFAQSLLAQAKEEHPEIEVPETNSLAAEIIHTAQIMKPVLEDAPFTEDVVAQMDDLYTAGVQEVFGKQKNATPALTEKERAKRAKKYGKMLSLPADGGALINPFQVSYAMMAKLLKRRRTIADEGGLYSPKKAVEARGERLPLTPSLHLPF